MKQKLFLILICSAIVSLSFFQDIANYFHTPPERFFVAPHNFPPDHHMFLSEINQAANGHFFFIDKFTSEPQRRNLIHPLYIPVGIFSAFFNIPAYQAYQIIRFLMGVLLLLTSYWFITKVFPKNPFSQKLAFFFTALLPGYVKIIQTPQGWELKRYLEAWSGSDLLVRNAFQPHAMVKTILFLILIVLYTKNVQFNKKSFLILSIVSTLEILFEPVNILFLGLLWLFLIISQLVTYIKKSQTREELIQRCLFLSASFLPSFLAFLYMFIVFSGPEWQVVKAWEKKTFFFIDLKEYVLTFGPLIPLAIPGFLLLLKKPTPLKIFMLLVVIATLALLFVKPVAQILQITNFRFFIIPLYLFFAIGATETIISFVNLFKKRKSLITFTPRSSAVQNVVGLIVLIPLIAHIPFYSMLIGKELQTLSLFSLPGFFNYIYPTKITVEGLLWLKNNSSDEDIVFSNGFLGNIIPGIAGNTVALGHQVSTINYWEKDKLFYRFINGKIAEEEAKKILTSLRVDYIAIEDWEKEGSNLSRYSFLSPVFSNSALTIYKALL